MRIMAMLEKKAAKKEDFKKSLHVSHTQLNTYLQCPRKYNYQYVLGLSWERKPAALAFGKAIHIAVARYYRELKEKKTVADTETLVELFRDCLSRETGDNDVAYKRGENKEFLLSMGEDLIKVFTENVRPQCIEAVEMPFNVELVDIDTGEVLEPKLVGIFDLIESDEEGNLIISELKTAGKKPSDGQYDLQATIYSYALKEMGYGTTESNMLVRYDVLMKTKQPSLEKYFVVKGEKDYHRMLRLTRDVLKAIEHEVYYPNSGWYCSDCPFKKACEEDT
jgi:putative RecB family exonuclease